MIGISVYYCRPFVISFLYHNVEGVISTDLYIETAMRTVMFAQVIVILIFLIPGILLLRNGLKKIKQG